MEAKEENEEERNKERNRLDRITKEIIGGIYEVGNVLGPGFMEKVKIKRIVSGF